MFSFIQRPWRRLAALLCTLAVCGLLPLAATGAPGVRISDGDEDRGGDPIDSNDFGTGGGGGSHDDIENYTAGSLRLPGAKLGKWLVLLVPDSRYGVTVFSFVIIERGAIVGEARYAQ